MLIIIYKLKFIFIMRVFQSVFLNDTLDHDTRDQKKVKSKKVGERFENRNERFVPLHCE